MPEAKGDRAPAAGPPPTSQLADPSTLPDSIAEFGSTTKWIIGGLGAIATLLVAGTQLTDIGRADVSAGRLALAWFGFALALVAVVFTLYLAARVLAPMRFGLGRLAHAETPPKSGGESRMDARERRELIPVKHFLEAQPDFFLGRPPKIEWVADERERLIRQQLALSGQNATTAEGPTGELKGEEVTTKAQAEEELLAIDRLARSLTVLARYELVRRRFRTATLALCGAALVGAIGIGLFAWATSEDESDAEDDQTAQPTIGTVNVPVEVGPIEFAAVPPPDQATADALAQLAAVVTSPEALNVIDQLLEEGGAAAELADGTRDAIIQAVADDLLKPLVEHGLDELFGDEPPGAFPANWSQLVQVQVEARLVAQGYDDELAAELAAALRAAIEAELAPELPPASASASIGGTNIVIVNNVDHGGTETTDDDGDGADPPDPPESTTAPDGSSQGSQGQPWTG